MRFVAVLSLMVLGACTGKPSLEDAKLSDRKLDLESFFDSFRMYSARSAAASLSISSVNGTAKG